MKIFVAANNLVLKVNTHHTQILLALITEKCASLLKLRVKNSPTPRKCAIYKLTQYN